MKFRTEEEFVELLKQDHGNFIQDGHSYLFEDGTQVNLESFPGYQLKHAPIDEDELYRLRRTFYSQQYIEDTEAFEGVQQDIRERLEMASSRGGNVEVFFRDYTDGNVGTFGHGFEIAKNLLKKLKEDMDRSRKAFEEFTKSEREKANQNYHSTVSAQEYTQRNLEKARQEINEILN